VTQFIIARHNTELVKARSRRNYFSLEILRLSAAFNWLTVGSKAFLSSPKLHERFSRSLRATLANNPVLKVDRRRLTPSLSFLLPLPPARLRSVHSSRKSDYYREIYLTVPFARISIHEMSKTVKRPPFQDTTNCCNAPHCILTQQSTLPMCTVAYTSV